ncbi:MAG: PKD domain-containing protein, partial [Planctomycetaceae bacterium]|nr:PKD domain-containing protein [Planctomycetaceae bacterium]
MPFEWLHSRLVKPFVDGRQRPRRGVRSRAIAMEILEERTLLFAASVTWNPSYSQSYEGLRGIRVGWYPLEEGEALSVGDATQYTIDYGDGYSDSSEDIYGDEKHVPTFYHAFDQGTYLITVTASNRLGSASDTTTLEIPNNVAPGVQLRIDGDPDAGKFLPLGHYAPSASLSGYGTIKDPGPDAPWTGTIDFGDGTGAETLVVTPLDRAIHYRREGLQFENPGIGTVGNAAYFNFSHTYEKAGTYTWTVNVTDKDGATSPINFIAHVPEQDIQFAYAYWDSYGAPVAGEEDDGIVEEELFGEGVTDARDPGTLSILYGVTNPTWIVEPIEVQLYWSNAEGTLTPATANLLEADPRKPELRVPPDVLLPPSSDTTSLVIEFDPNDKIEEVDDSNNRGEVALLPEIELLDEPDFAWVAVKVGEASSAPFGGLDIPYRITSIHLIDQPIEVQPYWSNDAGELTPATDEVLIVDPSETKLHIDAEAFKAPNADTTSVVVSLDPNDKISERNETNNQGQANLVLDVGALRLEGNFDRDDATGRWDANGLVVIGLKPHSNEPMRRLVTVDGSLWYDGNVIHVEGTVSAALGQLNAPLFQGTFEIDAGDAVTRFVQESVSGLAGDYTLAGAELSIDTIEFVNPGGGSVSDGRIELQGSLTLPTPGGPLVLEVEGANRIVVSGSGVSLRGEITVTNPIAAFKIAELDVLNQSLRLGYLPTMSGQPARLYLTGNVTLPNLSTSDIFKFGGVKAALDGTVYLWVENGRLQTEYNGTLTVSDVLTIPGVNWELEQIKLTVRTEDDFVQGFASVGIPFSGIKKYLPLAHLRIQGLLQFVDGKLNAIALQGDHIDLPIPLTGGLGRFQRLSGGVINLALDSLKDIEDVLFVGGVGATFLPEFEVTVPPVLGDLNFITSLLRIDLDVGANPAQLFHLQTKFPRLPGENLQIGGTVEASVLGGLPAPFAQGLLTLSGTGTYIQNGATIVHDLRGTFTSLSGVVTGKGHLHM